MAMNTSIFNVELPKDNSNLLTHSDRSFIAPPRSATIVHYKVQLTFK